jgi:hypothetical protein
MRGQEIVTADVVHPLTGEVLDVAGLDGNHLAELHDQLVAVGRLQRQAVQMTGDELRQRFGGRRNPVVTGGWEVSIGGKSEWDADELEGVLRDLVETGELHAGDVTEVIRHITTVAGKEANSLVKRLSGPAKDAVERCRSYVPGTITVKRSVALPEAKDTP